MDTVDIIMTTINNNLSPGINRRIEINNNNLRHLYPNFSSSLNETDHVDVEHCFKNNDMKEETSVNFIVGRPNNS